MPEELYKKYRPKSFKDVIGQDEVVRSLIEMGKSDTIPHTILFTGPSGCGKTTLARILKVKLKCSDRDFYEINGADARGIEMIRDIRSRMFLAPIGGDCRIWLCDEAHQLTGPAQESFLKILEDTPSHVYFFLASTDPSKLKRTIITRSTEIKVKELTEQQIIALVNDVCRKEEKEVSEAIPKKIAEIAEGSARKALVLLHQIISIDDEEKQLETLQRADVKREAIEIARALLNDKTSWKQMAEILKNVKEDPEQIRWMVLGYASKVALSRPDRACAIIDEFRDNFFDSKRAGLIASCYNVLRNST
jgi:DNA polymerase III gamma/tau subunit